MIPKSLELSVSVQKHGKQWVAYSPALDISTAGKSKKDAQNKFEELVRIFFEELAEMGKTNLISRY